MGTYNFTGMLEYWNDGMGRETLSSSSIPSFQINLFFIAVVVL
jgi:hypothetical protein